MNTDPVQIPVSVVIPTLNEEHHLPFLLDSLLKNTYPIEIIIVDGMSEDRTSEVVQSYASRSQVHSIRLIDSGIRHIAHQRNLGAKAAYSDILIFLDADVILPSENTIVHLLSEFNARNLVAANPKFIAHPHEETFLVRSLFKIIRLVHRSTAFWGRPYFAGACIITQKDVFWRINGFDETLALSEDTDYGFRAKIHGRCGVLSTEISTSIRRIKKTSLRDFWEIVKSVPRYLRTGKVNAQLAQHYTFGNY